MKLGPLPVEVTVDVAESSFTLRHGEHELELEVEDPLALLVQLGLLLVAEAPPARSPRKKLAKKTRRPPKSKPGPRPVPPAGGKRCGRSGCDKTFKPSSMGRPQIYCSKACGKKAYRAETEALGPAPEIPESASGMRERAKKVAS